MHKELAAACVAAGTPGAVAPAGAPTVNTSDRVEGVAWLFRLTGGR